MKLYVCSKFKPDEIFNGIVVPAGRYTFRNLNTSYTLGTQHFASGSVSYDYGGFYDGTKHTLAFTRGRMEPAANLFIEPGVSINWVDIPQGQFVAKVLNSRVTYTFTPRIFMSALVQYGSEDSVLSANARFRWEYRPGSDLFVVYNDGRDTLGHGFPRLEARSFTVKLTRFFRL